MENTKKKDLAILFRQFTQLLKSERIEIGNIYLIAVFSALLSLLLPLGIQSIFNLVLGAKLSISLAIIITLIIIGVFLSGYLQLLQIKYHEAIQQRLFAKSSLFFANSMAKVETSLAKGIFLPEITNRFFDTIIIQKSLAKILVDLTGAILLLVFALILLAIYHPLFIVPGLILLFLLVLFLFYYAPISAKSSKYESNSKYEMVFWLEELARTQKVFKLSNSENFTLLKTDGFLKNWVKFRQEHFSTLVNQYWVLVFFKVLFVAAMLVLGTTLVLNQAINFGQFVAIEIIFVLIISSIEKIISTVDVAYDVLISSDKLNVFSKLPVQDTSTISFLDTELAVDIRTSNLRVINELNDKIAIDLISFELPAAETLAIVGGSDSGKHLLMQVLSGDFCEFIGEIDYQKVPLKGLKTTDFFNHVAYIGDEPQVFFGTILENLCLNIKENLTNTKIDEVHKILEITQLNEWVRSLPLGLETIISPSQKSISFTLLKKIEFARVLMQKPLLLLIEDFTFEMSKNEQEKWMDLIACNTMNWTTIIATNNINLIVKSDKMLVLEKGLQTYFGAIDTNHSIFK